MAKKVYIILLNYNGWKNTIECLETLLKNDYLSYQIIIVDNKSPDNSMKYLLNWANGEQEIVYQKGSQLKYLSQPNKVKPIKYTFYHQDELAKDMIFNGENENSVVFIQAKANNGFSSGNNIGINYALLKNDFEYIWLLNNDTVIESNTISKLIDSYKDVIKNENLGILSTIQMYYANPSKVQASAGRFNKWTGKFWNHNTLDFKQNDISYPYGASMFFDKNMIDTIGILDEEYFLYCEEIDLTERLKQNNLSIYIDKDIKIYHKHGQSMETIQNDLQFYHSSRSKILFYKKYYKLYLPIMYMRVAYGKIRQIYSKFVGKR